MKSVVVYFDGGPSSSSAGLGLVGGGSHGHSVSATVDDTAEEKMDKEMPVAWCFMGIDASLATLHVEAEHRGKGIAVLLSREMMRWGMDDERGGRIFRTEISLAIDDDDKDSWVHADVATENMASRKVMEKLGGQSAWTITWTVVELLDS
jgi:ribosomal protein S18 acetylase RimI-like enzyme